MIFCRLLGSADHDDGPCPIHDLGLGSEDKPFEAALLFNDPNDWYRDLQLFTDVALSGDPPSGHHQESDPCVRLRKGSKGSVHGAPADIFRVSSPTSWTPG